MKETVGDVRIELTRGTVLGGHTPIWPHSVEIIGNIYENPELLEPPLGNGAEPIKNLPEDDWREGR